MAVMATKSDVLPPLEEWDINLEVVAKFISYLKASSNFRKQICGLAIRL